MMVLDCEHKVGGRRRSWDAIFSLQAAVVVEQRIDLAARPEALGLDFWAFAWTGWDDDGTLARLLRH